MDRLHRLWLGTNLLENVDKNLLDVLPALVILDLSNNKLTSIPWDFFSASEKLWRLDIRGNNFSNHMRDKIRAFLRFHRYKRNILLER